jgi:septum formation protein
MMLRLGSGSPRRKEILKILGFDFVVSSLDLDETLSPEWDPDSIARELALMKNRAYRNQFPHDLLLTADTVVLWKGQSLAKPGSREEAKIMLGKLSGETHQVITGVAISRPDKIVSFSSVTEVVFRPLQVSEIEYYIENAHPFDKAGSYGIQDWLGYIGIQEIRGCYYNVVGLPASEVYRHLTQDFHYFPQGINGLQNR